MNFLPFPPPHPNPLLLRPPPAALTLALLTLLLTAGCTPKPSTAYQGYLEADFVHIASPLPGTLQLLHVHRGQLVHAGNPLFQLEHAAESAAHQEAESRLRLAEARLANLQKGRRPSEIAALEAHLEQARANATFWTAESARRETLFASHVISRAELDHTRTQKEANDAAVLALTADLQTARLGAREDEIRAAEAELNAAQAALAQAQWALDQKTRQAPAAGRVHDTLFRPGEFVPAGAPVVRLLPPANLKVRFYVPQAALASFTNGTPVHVRLDGQATPRPATVSYVSTQVEFTPPVIYNRENRAKLMVMVEASFAPPTAQDLHPGQPADVLPPSP